MKDVHTKIASRAIVGDSLAEVSVRNGLLPATESITR